MGAIDFIVYAIAIFTFAVLVSYIALGFINDPPEDDD